MKYRLKERHYAQKKTACQTTQTPQRENIDAAMKNSLHTGHILLFVATIYTLIELAFYIFNLSFRYFITFLYS